MRPFESYKVDQNDENIWDTSEVFEQQFQAEQRQ